MSAAISSRANADRALDQERHAIGWVLALGMAGLFTSPAGMAGLAVTVPIGILAIALPAAGSGERSRALWMAATALGIAAFWTAGRFAPLPALPLGTSTVAVIIVAAVAEEAFFRRLAFSWFSRWGDLAAIALTSIAFAIVHVPAYGIAALPIDLAAGLLFGWQRWATGSWLAAAVTHAAANLLQAI
ncbi:MAG TPA: CPBP family glutamic-type intramembrane protease [Actinomycetota bacterium]|nr:CPBP family glutamic-type intramembrane protease [Actinomycetota bacterium]